MLYPFLSTYVKFPLLGTILNSIYYGLIYCGIIVSCILMYRRLNSDLGYPKKQAVIFIVLLFFVSFPAGIVSSRAANMLYYPISRWSFDFLIEQFLNGKHQTFHASLVLPAILISVIMLRMKISLARGWDTIFLHIPLAHAFGRTGCLLVGCCWGNRLTINFWNTSVSFDNPVPLYAICINIGLYFFLKMKFNRIYLKKEETVLPEGSIPALYLISYGTIRFFLEFIRKEKIITGGLTQAQIAMIVYLILGVIIYCGVKFRKNVRPV
jgi:phosphatidylglycerol---prolipoprotein diacylglyceryl transferase